MAMILLVAGDFELAQSLRIMLLMDGHKSVLAMTMAEALDIGPGFSPALAIIDVDLPGGEGLEAISRVRRRLEGVEVVAICRESQSDHKLRVAKACGAAMILCEPDRRTLVEAVRESLGLPRRA